MDHQKADMTASGASQYCFRNVARISSRIVLPHKSPAFLVVVTKRISKDHRVETCNKNFMKIFNPGYYDHFDHKKRALGITRRADP